VRVYFDSSALVKRYLDEPGTDEVLAWCDKATALVVAVIAVPEIVSAWARLVREGRLDAAEYAALKAELAADLVDAWLCEVSPPVVQRAIAALEAHPLRAADALHIGAALVADVAVFVSADARQSAAAAEFGLQVVAV
jgi:predicted nucleic acid-binding protein